MNSSSQSRHTNNSAGATPLDPAQVPSHEIKEAKKLLEQSGADDLARQVTASTAIPPAATPQNEAFARGWGFASYLEMFEASKPVSTVGTRHWLVTNTGPDQWITWDDVDLRVLGTFKTQEEATAHAPRPQPAVAPPPTG